MDIPRVGNSGPASTGDASGPSAGPPGAPPSGGSFDSLMQQGMSDIFGPKDEEDDEEEGNE